jgi:hypothetical protein
LIAEHLLAFFLCQVWRMVMALPEIRLLQAAITVAKELNFSRAPDPARRIAAP